MTERAESGGNSAVFGRSDLKLVVPEATWNFLKKAIDEGAHLNEPEGVNTQEWARLRNTAGIYYGTNISLGKLGALCGYCGTYKAEGPRRRIREFMRLMYLNSSVELQQEHPFESLVFGKRVEKRDSLSPRTKLFRELVSLAPKVKEETEIRNFFGKVDRSFYNHHRELFVSVTKAAAGAGFNVRLRNLASFLDILDLNGIPYKEIRYLAPGGKHKGRSQVIHLLLPQQLERVQSLFVSAWAQAFLGKSGVVLG